MEFGGLHTSKPSLSWWDHDDSPVPEKTSPSEKIMGVAATNYTLTLSPMQIAEKELDNIVRCEICGGNEGFKWCASCQYWCVCVCSDCKQCNYCVDATDEDEWDIEGPNYIDPDEELEARAAGFMLPKNKQAYHDTNAEYRLEQYSERQAKATAEAKYYTETENPYYYKDEDESRFVEEEDNDVEEEDDEESWVEQQAKIVHKYVSERPEKIFDTYKCCVCIQDFGTKGLVKVICDPCGHVFCSSCILKIQNCAICRTEIISIFKVGQN